MNSFESQTTAADSSATKTVCGGTLPGTLRVLYVPGPHSPGNWLSQALETQQECQIRLVEAALVPHALEQLRQETFNAVLVDYDAGEGQSLRLVDAVRTGSHAYQPVLILGDEPDSRIATQCYEAGADAFIPVQITTPRELIWQIARAAERERLASENDQLRRRQQRQKTQERDEALNLIGEQEAILDRVASVPPAEVAWMEDQLRQLLQTYIVMGSGNLDDELHRFTGRVVQSGIAWPVVARSFSAVMRNSIEELGTRSSRHVYNRGNLLLLDLLLRLSPEHRAADISMPTAT